MPFQRGNPGKPKGAIGYKTRRAEDLANKLNCDPLEILLLFAKGDWEALGYDSGVMIKESGDGKSTFMEYTITPELRAQCAAKASEYYHAKKKSIEHTTKNAFEGMTVEQRLEAMRHAVQLLESEVKDKEPREVLDAGS